MKRSVLAVPLLLIAALMQGRASGEPSVQSSGASSEAKPFRDASLGNLKQLGLALKMWANESKGEVFPPLDNRPGHLTMQGDRIFPEYLTDTGLFVSPAHSQALQLIAQAERDPLAVVDDHSYWYLGYATPDEKTGLAFVAAYKGLIKAGKPLDLDLHDTQVGTIYRLRNGVERFFISDINNPAAAAQAQSQIPLMIERPGLQKGGSCVLFMDGHTEFIEYPGRFPMTERFIGALQSLDELKRPGPGPSRQARAGE